MYLYDNNWTNILTIFTSNLDAKTKRDPNHTCGSNQARQNDEAVQKENAREVEERKKKLSYWRFCSETKVKK